MYTLWPDTNILTANTYNTYNNFTLIGVLAHCQLRIVCAIVDFLLSTINCKQIINAAKRHYTQLHKVQLKSAQRSFKIELTQNDSNTIDGTLTMLIFELVRKLEKCSQFLCLPSTTRHKQNCIAHNLFLKINSNAFVNCNFEWKYV